MKNIRMLLILFLSVSGVVAQNSTSADIPFIEVTGSADIEVEPDEIRLSVIISGYRNEENKQDITLEVVDKKLMDLLSKSNIQKNSIILKSASTQGYWHYWWWYNKSGDPRLTKEYEILFDNYSRLNNVLSELPGPKEGFVKVNITQLKNKKITEYRQQTKIEAMKAAKEKARYLLESVGSTPGRLLHVIEQDEDDWGWYRPYNQSGALSNSISQVSLNAGNSGDEQDPSMQKIKLRYKIKARFEIK